MKLIKEKLKWTGISKSLSMLFLSITFVSVSQTTQAEVYIVDGAAFAIHTQVMGFKSQSKLWKGGRWVTDELLCPPTNGFILSVSAGTGSFWPGKKICFFDLFYGKKLKTGWKFINSEFVKITHKGTRYSIVKRNKNTDSVQHRIRLTGKGAGSPRRSIKLKNVTLEGPSGKKWTDAF